MPACSSKRQHLCDPLGRPRVTLAQTPHADLVPSPAEMALLDSHTITSGLVTDRLTNGQALSGGRALMERAGRGSAHWLMRRYGSELMRAGAVILCGPGNNGGDGLVVARYLRRWGIQGVTVIVVDSSRYSDDCSFQMLQLGKSVSPLLFFPKVGAVSKTLYDQIPLRECSEPELERRIKKTGLVIDALLGTGQKANPKDSIRSIIEIVERTRSKRRDQCPCVAIDMPSGMNGENGEVYEPHITAQATVSMELVKRGMLQYPGRSLCGAIQALAIGIEASPKVPIAWKVIRPEDVALPERLPFQHKGNFGHVYIVAGSVDMPGAATLSARAAAQAGAGLVTIIRQAGQVVGQLPPEVLQHVIERVTGSDSLPPILDRMRAASCTVVGPGLGISSEHSGLVRKILETASKEKLSLVLDADALTIVAELLNKSVKLKLDSCVMTPHPGEMGRLLSISSDQVQNDRYRAAKQLHEKTGAVVVLKGASTLVYSGQGGEVNLTGNSGMASGGSGDVLTGIIAAFVAQGLGLHEAARCGVYLHGLAGDYASSTKGSALLAGEITDYFPTARRALCSLKQ